MSHRGPKPYVSWREWSRGMAARVTIRNMKRAIAGCNPWLCVLALIGVTTSCTIYGGKKHEGWSGATGGEHLVRQFWADVKSKDFSDLEKHMAMSWVMVTPSGPLDRTATLERLRQMPVEDVSLGDFKVAPNGSDIVVTYTAKFTGAKGQNGPVRMMTVWQRGEKGWMAIAHAETT